MLNIQDAPITPTSIGSRSPHTLSNYLPPSPSASTMISEDDLDPARNYQHHQHHSHHNHHQQQQQQQHRRHLSTGAIPMTHSLSTSPIHSHFGHHATTLQPNISSHASESFDFINPHDPLSH